MKKIAFLFALCAMVQAAEDISREQPYENLPSLKKLLDIAPELGRLTAYSKDMVGEDIMINNRPYQIRSCFYPLSSLELQALHSQNNFENVKPQLGNYGYGPMAFYLMPCKDGHEEGRFNLFLRCEPSKEDPVLDVRKTPTPPEVIGQNALKLYEIFHFFPTISNLKSGWRVQEFQSATEQTSIIEKNGQKLQYTLSQVAFEGVGPIKETLCDYVRSHNLLEQTTYTRTNGAEHLEYFFQPLEENQPLIALFLKVRGLEEVS